MVLGQAVELAVLLPAVRAAVAQQPHPFAAGVAPAVLVGWFLNLLLLRLVVQLLLLLRCHATLLVLLPRCWLDHTFARSAGAD